MGANQINQSIAVLNDYPKEKFNVLVPVATMQALSNLQKIVVNKVQLDVDDPEKSKDIYREKSSNKYAVTKVGGMKLAAAANISIVSTVPGRTDGCQRCIEMARATGQARACGNCPHVNDVAVTVTVRVPEPSGGFRLLSATKEIDCTLEKAGMSSDAQYKRFLPHRTAIAESKAFMRAIRAALGLAAGYELNELRKPFIIAHVVPNLDAPEIKDAVAKSYLQSMGMLFETPSTMELAQAANEQQPEVIPDDGNDGGVQMPWENALPAAEPDGPPCCDECGTEITSFTGADGKLWTASMLVDYSMEQFNRVLCPDCQRKAFANKRG